MKRFFVLMALVMSLFCVAPAMAACVGWEVEGRTATIEISGFEFALVFGYSFVGPCPAGTVALQWVSGADEPLASMQLFYYTDNAGNVTLHYEQIGAPFMTLLITEEGLVWDLDPTFIVEWK